MLLIIILKLLWIIIFNNNKRLLFDIFVDTVGAFQSLLLSTHGLILSQTRPRKYHCDTHQISSCYSVYIYVEIIELMYYHTGHMLCINKVRRTHIPIYSLMMQPNKCVSGTSTYNQTTY